MLSLAKSTTGDAARPLAVEAASERWEKRGKRSLRVEKWGIGIWEGRRPYVFKYGAEDDICVGSLHRLLWGGLGLSLAPGTS